VVDHDADAGSHEDRRGRDQLVLLAMDLEEPAHLLDPGEQPVGARLGELPHPAGGEVDAEQAAVVGAVRLGADQQPVGQPVGVEDGEELLDGAGLAGMRRVDRLRRVRIRRAAEHVRVAVGGAIGGHVVFLPATGQGCHFPVGPPSAR
jgi:hypothetical protein